SVRVERLGPYAAGTGQQVGHRQLGDVDLERLEEGFHGKVAHHLLQAGLPELRRELLESAVGEGFGEIARAEVQAVVSLTSEGEHGVRPEPDRTIVESAREVHAQEWERRIRNWID